MMSSDAMSPLKELWESKDGPYEYGTRSRGLVKIHKPCPTMLGGCTPSQIAVMFPSQVIGGGFIRRCNFVYEGDRTKFIAWPPTPNGTDPIKTALVEDLRQISQLRGTFSFDPIAKKEFEKYCDSIGSDEFADESTAGYETSKPIHALKLAMALTLSRYDSMVINFVDMQRAIMMVDKCAAELPKVFRAVGDSEFAVIMDKVMRYVDIKSKTGYVTRSDIMNALWRDIGSNNNLDVILGALEAGRLIRIVQQGNVTLYKIYKPQII